MNRTEVGVIVEEKVAKIFQRLLRISSVDLNRSFFDLGGHSLLVLKLLVEINHEFGTKLSPSDFAANSSVRAIAALVCGLPRMPETAGSGPGSAAISKPR
ncbi:MAG: acyl carrier protein [Verrucomicrobia bacterium]|nr:acyl carrier protein [Verrucomicrobiota bacterium]